MIQAWSLCIFILFRILKQDRAGRLTLILSMSAMGLGVAALILAMAIVSGYESTLKRSIIDSFGHLVVLRQSGGLREVQEFSDQLEKIVPYKVAQTPFVMVEAILIHNQKISGVFVEGIDLQTYENVIQTKKHLIQGEFRLDAKEGSPSPALVGKGIQRRFDLNVGDTFRLAVPLPTSVAQDRPMTRVYSFHLVGVLDLGREQFDERYILVEKSKAQDFAQLGNKVSGFRIRLSDENKAQSAKIEIDKKLGFPYTTRTWFDSNRNVFMAAQYEKVVIFIIVLLIVVAASFTISTSLLVSVMRRYQDISILKAMGATQRFVYWLFAAQGVFIGALGCIFGFLLGIGICELFMIVQEYYPLFPAEIYRIDKVDVEIRPMDLILILSLSLFICFLSSLLPARKGARLSAIEGLRYE